MSPNLMKKVIFLMLAAVAVTVTVAQVPRKGKSRNADTQNPYKKPEQNQDNAVPQSPFTPPHGVVVKEVSTKIPEVSTAPPAVKAVDLKTTDEDRPVSNPGSPFSPPTSSKWQEQKQTARPSAGGNRKPQQQKQHISNGKSSQWLDSLEERQRDNVGSIPPLASIDVGDVNKDSNKSKKRFKVKPNTSVYQEKGQRDIHDAEPGATPWTRYTDKPRINEEVSGSGKANARCGKFKYNPRNQICCQGKVLRRHGVSPACCKGEAYDTVFNKCCNGIISVRTNGQSDC
ncbi:unnamed protein product [Candidula unifasciata]|uniref:Galaxin-like repeats domain-containing protein n=1 Tax=Candidula unifasciata TaxID=100452 RepID=A0A8S3ZDT7_9EUPU|nr:unnamed protein product [Candidula unifasciata]